MKHIDALRMVGDPDMLLGSDGTVYVNADVLPIAQRIGRSVLRVVELSPSEAEEVLLRFHRITDTLIKDVIPNAQIPKRTKTGKKKLALKKRANP